MIFLVMDVGSDVWLVTNRSGMDARFSGECARDRAYAYMYWMNEGQAVNQRIDALRAELDQIAAGFDNLREQLLPPVR